MHLWVSDWHIWTQQFFPPFFLLAKQFKLCPAALGSGGHEQLFSSPTSNSRLDWDLGFDLATPERSPLCSFCCVLGVDVLLGNKSSPKSYLSCRLKQIILQDLDFYLCKPFRTRCWEASWQHDAAAASLHGGDGVFVVMHGVGCCV